jgi:hypothetical protein
VVVSARNPRRRGLIGSLNAEVLAPARTHRGTARQALLEDGPWRICKRCRKVGALGSTRRVRAAAGEKHRRRHRRRPGRLHWLSGVVWLRTPPVACTTEDLPALPAGAEARFTEDVHAVVAEPRRGHRCVAAVAATGFDATVDGVPRKSRFGHRMSPHQACGDALGWQLAGEHGGGFQMDSHTVAIRDIDESGPITARGRVEAVDLAAPYLGVWDECSRL